MSDWNETKSILLEIEQLYSREDDLREITDINKMILEIENERNGIILDFRELIRSIFSLSLSIVLSLFPFDFIKLIYFRIFFKS